MTSNFSLKLKESSKLKPWRRSKDNTIAKADREAKVKNIS